jgi:hypothetical protein
VVGGTPVGSDDSGVDTASARPTQTSPDTASRLHSVRVTGGRRPPLAWADTMHQLWCPSRTDTGAGREMDRETDREADRDRDKDSETDRETDRIVTETEAGTETQTETKTKTKTDARVCTQQ